jgi:acyl-CoA thioesterase-1
VTLVPFLMNGVLGNPDLISDDGVHPNSAGARSIAETIFEYVFPIARTVAKDAATTPDTR